MIPAGGYSGSSEATATGGNAHYGGFNFSPVKGIDPKLVVIGAVVIAFIFILPRLRK